MQSSSVRKHAWPARSSTSAGCTTPAALSTPVSMMATTAPLPVTPPECTEATPVSALASVMYLVTTWSALIEWTSGFCRSAVSDASLTASDTAGMRWKVDTSS